MNDATKTPAEIAARLTPAAEELLADMHDMPGVYEVSPCEEHAATELEAEGLVRFTNKACSRIKFTKDGAQAGAYAAAERC